MKRTPRLVLVTSLIALVTLFLSSLVSAHSVTVTDSGTADWFPKSLLPRTNAGHILRNGSNQGEYAWHDAVGTATHAGDQRVVGTTNLTRAVDLEQFRVTGDAQNLYFLAETEFIPLGTAGLNLPQFQIAIDSAAGGTSTLID